METKKPKAVKKAKRVSKKEVKKDAPKVYICTDMAESEMLQGAGVRLLDIKKSGLVEEHTFETTEEDVKAIKEIK